jgi:hypothetical protein
MTVTTVRDFSVVFDAYMQFEESMLAAKMEQLEEELDQDDADDDEDVRPPPLRHQRAVGKRQYGILSSLQRAPPGIDPKALERSLATHIIDFPFGSSATRTAPSH